MSGTPEGGRPLPPPPAGTGVVEILRTPEPARRNWRRLRALFAQDPEALRRDDPQAYRALELAAAMDAFLGAWPR